jgi:hypothetical protein
LSSRLSADFDFRVPFDDGRFRIGQRVQLDLKRSEICCWDGALSLALDAFELATEAHLTSSGTNMRYGDRVVSIAPLIHSGNGTDLIEGQSVGVGRASVDFGSFGMAGSAGWPLDFAEPPDLGASLWFGRSSGFRLRVSGMLLNDGEAAVTATLIQTP